MRLVVGPAGELAARPGNIALMIFRTGMRGSRGERDGFRNCHRVLNL
jgi:hypothetical protein